MLWRRRENIKKMKAGFLQFLPKVLPAAMGIAGTVGSMLEPGSPGGPAVIKGLTYKAAERGIPAAWDYNTAIMESLSKGQLPPWFQKLEPILRKQAEESAYTAAYGRPGQRTGYVQQMGELGGITGVGPKATFAQTSRAGQQYADKMEAINAYLASKGIDVGLRESQFARQAAAELPQGPPSTVVNMPPTESPWAGLAGLGGMLMANNPWGGGSPGGGGGFDYTSLLNTSLGDTSLSSSPIYHQYQGSSTPGLPWQSEYATDTGLSLMSTNPWPTGSGGGGGYPTSADISMPYNIYSGMPWATPTQSPYGGGWGMVGKGIQRGVGALKQGLSSIYHSFPSPY